MQSTVFRPGDRVDSHKLRVDCLKALYATFFKLKKVTNIEDAFTLKINVLVLMACIKKTDLAVYNSLSNLSVLLCKQINEKIKEFDESNESIRYIFEENKRPDSDLPV